MSPFAYTSSNPKQEASYNAKARGHARGQSDALTYGGKCVAQRGTQFANHAQEISGAVTVFFFLRFGRFIPHFTTEWLRPIQVIPLDVLSQGSNETAP